MPAATPEGASLRSLRIRNDSNYSDCPAAVKFFWSKSACDRKCSVSGTLRLGAEVERNMELPSRTLAILRVCLSAIPAALATALAVHGIDAYLAHLRLPADATILDDVLLGLLVGTLVFVLELHHQREIARQQRKVL